MTFITRTNDLRKTVIVINNYHRPYMIYTIRICQQHQDQQPIYVHHEKCHLNQRNYVNQSV